MNTLWTCDQWGHGHVYGRSIRQSQDYIGMSRLPVCGSQTVSICKLDIGSRTVSIRQRVDPKP
eukprot:3388179-Pyramimonas_sp.AAC.1